MNSKTNLVSLDSIFEVNYGLNLELNKLRLDPDGVNFVSRTSRNNGVSAKVAVVKGLAALPAGLLTVAGGGSVLETFVQNEPFYSGRDLYYLTPPENMPLEEKLYYCMVIRTNRYRYSFGRQANRTLRGILIPARSEVPTWVHASFSSTVDAWSGRLLGLK